MTTISSTLNLGQFGQLPSPLTSESSGHTISMLLMSWRTVATHQAAFAHNASSPESKGTPKMTLNLQYRRCVVLPLFGMARRLRRKPGWNWGRLTQNVLLFPAPKVCVGSRFSTAVSCSNVLFKTVFGFEIIFSSYSVLYSPSKARPPCSTHCSAGPLYLAPLPHVRMWSEVSATSALFLPRGQSSLPCTALPSLSMHQHNTSSQSLVPFLTQQL